MGVVEAFVDVFESIVAWLVSAIQSVVPIFWTAGVDGGAGSLTFMGVLAIMALCISIFFLVVGIVQRFLRFRS